MDLFEKFVNLSIDNLNNMLKENNVLNDYDDSKKTLILFVVVFIVYILYTIRNSILPALLTASAIAGIFYFNKSKVTNYIKKYNLDKITSVGKWINS
jgi:hypothetical protein